MLDDIAESGAGTQEQLCIRALYSFVCERVGNFFGVIAMQKCK